MTDISEIVTHIIDHRSNPSSRREARLPQDERMKYLLKAYLKINSHIKLHLLVDMTKKHLLGEKLGTNGKKSNHYRIGSILRSA